MIPEEHKKLFAVAKIIAESDSIGEGYGYCDEFTEEMFMDVIDKKVYEDIYQSSQAETNVEYIEVAKRILNIVESGDIENES